MRPLSYSGYRFPADIIQRAVWMYPRFTLSYRDAEELLAERGIVVTYESIRERGSCMSEIRSISWSHTISG
jgi:transposase-like protein